MRHGNEIDFRALVLLRRRLPFPYPLNELFTLLPFWLSSTGFGFVNQADINKLITRKFKQRPATQAEMRDCSAVIGRDQLAQAKF